MTGISYMIPVVVSGALISAIPNLWSGDFAGYAESGIAYYMYTWGSNLMGLMYYVLAMFTSFSIAGRPGYAAGLVAGWYAVNADGGFVAAVLGGIIAGYLAKAAVKYIKVPESINNVKSIILIPLLTSLIMFVFMHFAIAPLSIWIMDLVYRFGEYINSLGLRWVLLGFFGICMSFGMGGPLCYGCLPLVYVFMDQGDMEAAAVACIASCVGNLGTALSVFLFPKKFDDMDRTNAYGCLAGWLVEITEFEIPFLMSDFKTFAPAYILSGFAAGVAVSFLHLEMPSDWGGMFTMLLSNNILNMIIVTLIEAAVVVLCVAFLRKDLPKEEEK